MNFCLLQLRQTRGHLCTLVALFLLASPGSAHAVMMNFNETGARAERLDLQGYQASQGFGPVGGSVANNSLGYAFQFQVAQQTQMKNIFADVMVRDYGLGEDYVAFDFKVYSGTSAFNTGYIPDVATLLEQQSVYLTNGEFVDKTYNDYASTSFQLDLDPGTYWLAYERAVGESMAPGWISDVKYEGSVMAAGEVPVMVNPEPASLGLFAMGLLGAGGLLRRKRGDKSRG